MKTRKQHETEIMVAAARLAILYRGLADELIDAAVILQNARDADSSLPVVSIERIAEVIKAGIVLHYLADRA